MNRSIEPNLAEWIITGLLPGAVGRLVLQPEPGSGWLKSYWTVDICQVRPMASRACTEIFGP